VPMTPTPRNAPCPCGSGKKYKLCCLSADGGTPPTSAAEVAAKAVRAKALGKLAAFGARPAFERDLECAFEAFWSPVFLGRDEEELAAAYYRDSAEGGEVMYFTLDAPTVLGKTVAERFLSEPRKGLLATEQDYLRRLSAARMSILRVEEVRKNRGLTCTDLWSGERMDIREDLRTHDVGPGNVIGARPFLAADGVWELVGAIYPFTPAQGDAVVAILRATCSAEREADPILTEERFLKQRAAAIINRFWFAHVFFPDDEDDYDEDIASAADEERRNADDAFTRRARRPAAAMTEAQNGEAPADFHTDVASADSQILELRDFLDSDLAPDAMPIDWLHGFLCAIACGPTTVTPLVWLTHVWGDTPPVFESPAQADHITGSIIRLASSIEQAVSAKTFVPLLRRSVAGDMTNIAQGWCAGFEEAIRLDAGGWAPLLEDEDQRVLLTPLSIIGTSSDAIEDDGNFAKAVTQSIDILPGMVSVIDDYWNPPQRSPLRAKRVLARRRPSNAGTTFVDVATTAHDPAQ
jgi:yecA family protein